jgi:hypothetical protein
MASAAEQIGNGDRILANAEAGLYLKHQRPGFTRASARDQRRPGGQLRSRIHMIAQSVCPRERLPRSRVCAITGLHGCMRS